MGYAERLARLDAAKRAGERSIRTVNLKFRRGAPSLALIMCTAPWIGALGMLSETPQVLYNLTHPFLDTASGVSEIIVLPAFGFAVAALAGLFHGILLAWTERFDLEMKAGLLQLLNDLVQASIRI